MGAHSSELRQDGGKIVSDLAGRHSRRLGKRDWKFKAPWLRMILPPA